MREEYRTFKCWRYKIDTHIHHVFEPGPDGKDRLMFASCSLQDSGKKCGGMQDYDRPCPLVLSEAERRAIAAERSSSE